MSFIPTSVKISIDIINLLLDFLATVGYDDFQNVNALVHGISGTTQTPISRVVHQESLS
jgi:hypothetical protein